MNIKALRPLLVIPLALAGLLGSARADLIRVQFEPNASFEGRAPINFTGVESSAASADPVFGTDGSNTWNHLALLTGINFNYNPLFSNLVDSAGAATGVGISFTGTLYSANDTPVDNNGSDALENEYFINYASTVGYTISGLAPNSRMALYLYSPNFQHYDSVDPVGQPSRAFTLTANGQSIFVPSGTGTGNNALAFVTANASGQISGTWTTAGNEGDWSGFQIATATVSSVPEPSSAVMMLVMGGAFGLAGAYLRRRTPARVAS
jgi:hypothetical protein